MPFYDYVCQACGRRIEVRHGVHATGPERCDACGGRLVRAISRPAIHFKGSGWAKMDARAQTVKTGDTTSSEGSDGKSSGTTEPAGEGTKEAPAAAETAAAETAAAETGGERSASADAGSAEGSARPAKEAGARSSRSARSGPATSAKRRA